MTRVSGFTPSLTTAKLHSLGLATIVAKRPMRPSDLRQLSSSSPGISPVGTADSTPASDASGAAGAELKRLRSVIAFAQSSVWAAGLVAAATLGAEAGARGVVGSATMRPATMLFTTLAESSAISASTARLMTQKYLFASCSIDCPMLSKKRAANGE